MRLRVDELKYHMVVYKAERDVRLCFLRKYALTKEKKYDMLKKMQVNYKSVYGEADDGRSLCGICRILHLYWKQ